METNCFGIDVKSVIDDLIYFIHSNRKLIIFVISLIAIASIFLIGDKCSKEVSASTANQKYFVCIDIDEGDTLWSIADMYISEEYSSVDEYVEELKELNQLTSDKIYSGATLVVPYYAP